MTAFRRGSILVLCLAIVVALMLIAFGFVRMVAGHHETNDSENRALLAREAAQMGLQHALEEIIRDYNAPGPSRIDDASHATFVSLDRAYESDYATDENIVPQLLNVDNVPSENNLVQSFGGPYNDWNSLANQQHLYDGRGRWHEPGFLNRSFVGFDPAQTGQPGPLTAVRFSANPWPTASALPDRSDGVFYDAHLKRITGLPGGVRDARTTARYRLRYAVGVQDLDGTLLVTGDPSVPYGDVSMNAPADPANPTAAERVARWGHALPQIVYATTKFGQMSYGWGTGAAGGSRIAHVFAGRGSTANFDIVGGAPVTFPYMFRNGTAQKFLNPVNSGPATALYPGSSAGGGLAIPNTETLVRALTGPQLSFHNFDEAADGIAFDSDGGRPDVLGRFTPFGRGLAKTPGSFGRWNSANTDTPWCVNILTAPAAVVYGMVAGYMPPGAIQVYFHQKPPVLTPVFPPEDWVGKSYSGAVLGTRDLFVGALSTAFPYAAPTANGMTPNFNAPDTRAPKDRYPGQIDTSETVAKAIGANGFNGFIGTEYVNDNLGRYLRATAKPTTLGSYYGGEIDATGRPEVVRTASRYKEDSILPNPSQPRTELSYWQHGGLVGSSSTETPGPTNAATWNPIRVYLKDQYVYYHPSSDPSNAAARLYRALSDVPLDPILPNPPVILQGHRPDMTDDLVLHGGTPPAYWIEDPTASLWFDEAAGAHPDSIWDVLGNAMSATIAVARGQYYQYESTRNLGEGRLASPNVYFNGAPWSGARVTSIRDIDRLFVTNLGSNFDTPGDPVPQAGWIGWRGYIPVTSLQSRMIPFTPTWNLAKLATATTSVQVVADAGERIPRLITAGSPPQVALCLPQAPIAVYTDFQLISYNDPKEPRYDATKKSYTAADRTAIAELIINDFRLSFFGSSPAYGDAFEALDLNGDGFAQCSAFPVTGGGGSLSQRKAGARVAVTGNGTYFCNTGCFFVGKSRFWRVMVRGEVWDNVLQTATNSAQLDTVLCVDPANAAQEWVPGGTADAAKGQVATSVLYQRWFFNVYRGLMPRQQ